MKQRTNKALIKKMLSGTIDEAFLISAVQRYCQEVLADTTNWGNKSLINKDLWQVIAKRNLEIVEEHYK
jgi:hypothetical protein